MRQRNRNTTRRVVSALLLLAAVTLVFVPFGGQAREPGPDRFPPDVVERFTAADFDSLAISDLVVIAQDSRIGGWELEQTIEAIGRRKDAVPHLIALVRGRYDDMVLYHCVCVLRKLKDLRAGPPLAAILQQAIREGIEIPGRIYMQITGCLKELGHPVPVHPFDDE